MRFPMGGKKEGAYEKKQREDHKKMRGHGFGLYDDMPADECNDSIGGNKVLEAVL